VWSNKNNYFLNHSKVLLIDNLSIISSGNLSYSTFTKNRDFFIFTTDENINSKLKENFINDYN
jgi:phosphatidylserine/phosphatidylglycerophosphate/cardiolipin synthase-like enzyme